MMVMLIASVAAILIVGLTLRYRRRELQHKERLAAMEKGAPLPALTDFEQRAPWTPRMYLLRGLMWLFGGIGLTLFLLAVSSATHRPRSASDRAFAAQRMKDFGGSEEQIRQVQNDNSPREGMPPCRFCAGVDADRGGAFPGHRAAASQQGQREEIAIGRDRTAS